LGYQVEVIGHMSRGMGKSKLKKQIRLPTRKRENNTCIKV